MKIAITSPNAKTIAGHAGKCPGYLIYNINQDKTVTKSHIKLTKEQVFKNFSGALSQTHNTLFMILMSLSLKV